MNQRMEPDRAPVRKWMDLHARDHKTATELAEAAAAAFDVDEEGGPLDDPDHWIWDEAVDAMESDDT